MSCIWQQLPDRFCDELKGVWVLKFTANQAGASYEIWPLMNLDTMDRVDISKILEALDEMSLDEKLALFKILDSYREVIFENRSDE